MSRTRCIKIERLKPGHICRGERNVGSGKRVREVERLPDFTAYYGKVRRYLIHFADGTNERIENGNYAEVYVLATDRGRIIDDKTFDVALTEQEDTP